jgi:hypothetical protein
MASNTVASPADAEKRSRMDARAAERFAARHVLWSLSRLKNVRKCGRVSHDNAGVGVRVTTDAAGRHAGFSNLVSCGSVWACPVCSARIAGVRQNDIQAAMLAHYNAGGRVGFGTVTMQHHKGQTLEQAWEAAAAGWNAARSGRSWHLAGDDYGVERMEVETTGPRPRNLVERKKIDVIRLTEVTHGKNGWHVHFHFLLFLGATVDNGRRRLDDNDVQVIVKGMFGRWQSALRKKGFDAIGEKVYDVAKKEFVIPGWNAQLVPAGNTKIADYFTKSTYGAAAMEMTRGDMKDAKRGNRTPFGILRGLVRDLGERTPADAAADEALWSEWERVSKGRRQIVWSNGLRSRLGLDVELTDEEIVDQDEGGENVATITADMWHVIVKGRADYLVRQAFEHSDRRGRLLLAYVQDQGPLGLFRYRSRFAVKKALTEPPASR